MSAPSVRGTLRLDAAGQVTAHGALDARDLWSRCVDVPRGVHVELHIGAARFVVGDLREVAGALRHAGTIVVVGANGAGVGAVYAALSTAYRTERR